MEKRKMSQTSNFHMTPDEFRHHGKALIDWIADYYEHIEQYSVLPTVGPGDIRDRLPADPPQQGESFETMMRDVEQIIMPGITHWQSPNFYAFFPANTSGPAILGELLSAGLGVQGMLWLTSPACTELETHVLDWLVEMLGLPASFLSTNSGGGVIQDTASTATLTAMVAARERATGFSSNEWGNDARLRAYTSTQAHSSVEKAAGIAGIGRQNIRPIAVDEDYAMRPDELAQQITVDKANGRLPFFVCATVGTTSSTAIDPIRPIAEICREHNIWLHVDAAYAGTAALCPEFRHLQDGVELADSYAFNPHKWMFTNFDCDCFWVADRAALIRSLSILPAYLRNQATESGAVIDYRDWHIQLGRRFRALKLWFVIRHYGVEGLQHHVREHVRLAQMFARWVADHPDFELAAPVPLSLVCFRHKDGDDANRALLERLNQSGTIYLTHTVLDGRYTLRLAIGATLTEERHVAAAWEMIRETGMVAEAVPAAAD
ncbi:MAG: pyridoxal-dependent decarboxylase [Chloroflexota bacterium]|jgi:aromatic-L-amino-acid/L-tryptophan decarboxylase